MLSTRGRTRVVSAAAIFAALYAVLGLIPISPYLTGPGYLPVNKIVAPLAGILLGPVAAPLSVLLGTVADVGYTGQTKLPLGPIPLDWIPDLIVAMTAWFAFSGHRKAAVALPIGLVTVFAADPLSPFFIQVGGASVPFAWLHMISIAGLGGALVLEKRGVIGRMGPVFIAAVVFASLLAGQLSGTIVGQTLAVRVNGFITAEAWRTVKIPFIFYAYPAERVFYAIAAVILTLPVLRVVGGRKAESATVSG